MGFTLTGLTCLLMQINAAIDTGKYGDVSILEVQAHIEKGDLLAFLTERLGDDVDLGLYGPHHEAVLHVWLLDILDANIGQEAGHWWIRKSGLCLLVSWIAELIKRRDWEKPVEIDGWCYFPPDTGPVTRRVRA